MNSSAKKEARLFNLMKNLRDRKKKKKKKKKKKRKKNLLSFHGPSPLRWCVLSEDMWPNGYSALHFSFVFWHWLLASGLKPWPTAPKHSRDLRPLKNHVSSPPPPPPSMPP
jgi:hypothetical protein